MTRHLALALAALAAGFSAAQADSIFFTGLPASYVPGEPLAFTVGLPPITALGSYDIDVVLSSDDGLAGTDFAFDVAATDAVTPGDGYVFPSAANFLDAVNSPAANEQRLTVSDFSVTEVDVATGVNDLTVGVVVLIDPSFTGDLNLSIDADSLILDHAIPSQTPVAEFAAIVLATRAAGIVTISAVPEPGTMLLTCAALLCVARRSHCTVISARADCDEV